MKENFIPEILKLRKSDIFIFCNINFSVIAIASIVSNLFIGT